MILKPIVVELAKRGHEVTVISNFPVDEKLDNYFELIINPPHNYWNDIQAHFKINQLFQLTDFSVSQLYEMLNVIGYGSTEHAFKNQKINEFIHNDTTKFDLVIVEQFYQDAFLVFATKYKVPIISISTFGFVGYFTNIFGYINPWAYSPHEFLEFSSNMSFLERVKNIIYLLLSEYNRRFRHIPQQEKLVKKYLSHIPESQIPLSEIEKNISLMLMNSYLPLDISLPKVMGMVDIGGIQIKPAKTLPRDLKNFLDDSLNGVIYFNLGTNVQSADMPPEKLQTFLKVFSKLKERILWKWEDNNVPQLPKNVMIKNWLPQNDILAHPHVKLFITHGGLLSTHEAVYHGVPVIGIPIYCDQILNMKKTFDLGVGVSLNFQNITEKSLTWALDELLRNPSYTNQMRKTSAIFRDRPLGALETAMYWIEYIIRHNGAPHLQTQGVKMPWYQLYLIDVIAFLISSITVVLIIIYFFIKKLIVLRKKTVEHKKVS